MQVDPLVDLGNANPAARNSGNCQGTGEVVPFVNRKLGFLDAALRGSFEREVLEEGPRAPPPPSLPAAGRNGGCQNSGDSRAGTRPAPCASTSGSTSTGEQCHFG